MQILLVGYIRGLSKEVLNVYKKVELLQSHVKGFSWPQVATTLDHALSYDNKDFAQHLLIEFLVAMEVK